MLFKFQGEVARIVVRNGDIYEGVLKAVSPKVRCELLLYFTLLLLSYYL